MAGKLPVDRRRFLQITGGAVAATALSSSVARAASIAPAVRTRTIKDVEHIVVLMQENRSFDHYFGTLRGVRGFGDPHPALQPSGQSVWSQDGVLPFHPTAPDLGLQFIADLAHDWNSTHAALDGGAFDQWVQAKSNITMAHLNRDDIPFHYALADSFTICDNYHCSLLTSTDPNRYYMWTGYTGNDGTDGSQGPTGPVLDNAEAGYNWQTYPERLEAAGISWKIYQDSGVGLNAAGFWGWTDDAYIGNYGDNSLLYFLQYQNAQPGSALYEKARTGTNVADGGTFFDILAADVKNGTLPQVSWVVAPEAFCEHPNWPANYGAWYVSQVLDTLTSNPEVWSKTALLIMFDENDGFFDHVIPPLPASAAAAGGSTVSTAGEFYVDTGTNADSFTPGPYGLGPRVPFLAISPWSRGGWVCSEVFDATSIIRFIERRFGVSEPHISAWRRAICGDLTSAFDFEQRNASVPSLPSTAGYVPPDDQRHASYYPVPPATGSLPVQEPGVRPARPLPYDLRADAVVRDGTATITFASRGEAGAVFHVTSGSAPRDYTVGAGDSIAGAWPSAAGQDIRVHGPNGFYRQFTGEGPDIVAVPARDGLELAITSRSSGSVRLTLASAYDGQRSRVTVPSGSTVRVTVSTALDTGWYDVLVTSDSSSQYLRRLAGHIETGRPSVSDPALGRA
ncbi:MAG TPA: phospholipase C, phosphocholine-specific [Trebonia sp.]|nr:phospholipase C, phosphocholine-specific [Trebonia sp.]